MINEINPIVIELLHKRGIFDEDEVTEFLSEKPKKTYDPFLLLNLGAGVDLILSAARQGKKICIYGDYDADGITSISLMIQVLSHVTDRIDYYMPCRFNEGYGLNKAAIEAIHQSGAGMIITVDCGSVSYDEVEYAKAIGMDIVITDHHSITDKIPDCLVINPMQPDCMYPFKHLAGVGVAFKLAQGIQKKAGLPKSVLTDVLDLVAIGTIGDIMPLVDENRTMVKYGMKVLNRLQRKGMKSLVEVTCQNGAITSEHVAFIIVPHLNAVGRMFTAGVAVDLLISQDELKIKAAVNKLVESNKARKQVQEDTYQHCVEIVDKHLHKNSFLMVCSPDAHEGIAGIVAGKIKDKYHKPAIVITPSGELCKGTGRSLEKINLYELLCHFEGMFSKFGGHAGACGFLMKREDLRSLKHGLEEKMKQIIESDPTVFDKNYNIDITLQGKDITIELGELLEVLAPFGNQNNKPLLCIEEVQIKNPISMGEGGKHMRFTALCRDGHTIQCVLFNRASEYHELFHVGALVKMMGCLEVQHWNGNKRIQFFVEELLSM